MKVHFIAVGRRAQTWSEELHLTGDDRPLVLEIIANHAARHTDLPTESLRALLSAGLPSQGAFWYGDHAVGRFIIEPTAEQVARQRAATDARGSRA